MLLCGTTHPLSPAPCTPHLLATTQMYLPGIWQDFPALPEDGNVLQRNEGKWEFSLDESSDGYVCA